MIIILNDYDGYYGYGKTVQEAKKAYENNSGDPANLDDCKIFDGIEQQVITTIVPKGTKPTDKTVTKTATKKPTTRK